MGIKKSLKDFWKFLKKDSWASLVVTLLIAFVVIKFVFFPVLSFLTGTALPLVIVESCSMYHEVYGEEGLEAVLENSIYSDYGIDYGGAEDWNFRGGMNKGDVIFVVGSGKVEVGDIVIFDSNGGAAHPVIHRVINVDSETGDITTKGDHNSGLLGSEKDFGENRLIGKAVFKVPLVGWAKLIFFEGSRPASDKGFC